MNAAEKDAGLEELKRGYDAGLIDESDVSTAGKSIIDLSYYIQGWDGMF